MPCLDQAVKREDQRRPTPFSLNASLLDTLQGQVMKKRKRRKTKKKKDE
jgi:hypothetical protein